MTELFFKWVFYSLKPFLAQFDLVCLTTTTRLKTFNFLGKKDRESFSCNSFFQYSIYYILHKTIYGIAWKQNLNLNHVLNESISKKTVAAVTVSLA